jgi:hypothetical protein
MNNLINSNKVSLPIVVVKLYLLAQHEVFPV